MLQWRSHGYQFWFDGQWPLLMTFGLFGSAFLAHPASARSSPGTNALASTPNPFELSTAAYGAPAAPHLSLSEPNSALTALPESGDLSENKKAEKESAIAPSLPVSGYFFLPHSSEEQAASATAQTSHLSVLTDAETIVISQSPGEAAAALGTSDLSQTRVVAPPSLALQPDDAPTVISQATANSSDVPWRFVLEPYLYLPLETSGDVEVRNVTVPYDFSLGDILESLTFAFYGRFEAWKGPWAFVLDGYYFDTVESDSRNIPAAAVPPGLLPPQVTQVPIDGSVETAFFKLDFAGAYRFGDGNLANALSTAETEFDLGPFVFDAIAGLRLYSFSNEIQLSTPLGLSRDFSSSNTFIEPMIGGRARWNFADNLAAIAAANISGFGIGTDISVEGYAGVDWLFSGNTSLTATYRLTYIDYSEGSTGFNFFQHGPAVGVKFRF